MAKAIKKDNKELYKMILVMVGIAAVSGLILGFVSYITAKPIQDTKDRKSLEAIREVMPSDFDNNPFEEKTLITTKDGRGTVELYPARKDGKIVSIAIRSYSNMGFGGKIEMMVGFYLDGTINNYKVIDHKETPGLGTKIEEPKFMNQFKELNPRKDDIRLKQDGGEVDAITAATISSRAVTDALLRAYDAYIKFNTGN